MSDSKSLLASMSDSPEMSEEEALALQAKFKAEHGLESGEVSDKVNSAARLLMTGKHQEAVVAYTAIMEEHPEEAGTCEGQIGAAYYFLGDYEKAISFYEAAKGHGADASMMDDNIEEAREAIEKVARGEDPNDESGGLSPVTLLVLVAVMGAAAYFLFF